MTPPCELAPRTRLTGSAESKPATPTRNLCSSHDNAPTHLNHGERRIISTPARILDDIRATFAPARRTVETCIAPPAFARTSRRSF